MNKIPLSQKTKKQLPVLQNNQAKTFIIEETPWIQ